MKMNKKESKNTKRDSYLFYIIFLKVEAFKNIYIRLNRM